MCADGSGHALFGQGAQVGPQREAGHRQLALGDVAVDLRQQLVDRPVAVNGEVVVRPTLTLTVTFDHRVVDGARGAEFLETLSSLVEEPAGLVR